MFLHRPDQHLGILPSLHSIQMTTQTTDFIQRRPIDQQLFFAGSRLRNVDCRPYSPVCQLPIQHQFHIAGTFELLKDNFVHTAAVCDSSCGKVSAIVKSSRDVFSVHAAV